MCCSNLAEVLTFFTHRIVQRISYITIQTGAATSTVALTALFLYLASMTTNSERFCSHFVYTVRSDSSSSPSVSTFFGFCLGTTYSLTMLHNLNRRHALGARKSATDSESRAGDAETGPLGIGFSALSTLQLKPFSVSLANKSACTISAV